MEAVTSHKLCRGCGQEQPMDAFPRNQRSRDGRHSRCKGCAHAYYLRNRDALIRRSAERRRERAAERRMARQYQQACLEGENVKQCRSCGLLQDRDFFPRSRGRRDGLYPYCKRCSTTRSKAYATADPERNRAQRNAHREAMRLLVERAKRHPCSECGGEFHPAAMHFHHVDPRTKKATIARLVTTARREQIEAEIAKCVLLCANCHAVIHAQERG